MTCFRRSQIAIALAAAIAAAPALAQTTQPAPNADAAAASQPGSRTLAPFTVGLWGDMPYAKANDEPYIPALIADMNASDIAFSLYDGDIKDGSSQCTDAVFTDAIKMFDTLDKPAVYVPGDNEWTDCHRTNNGGYNNLERLATLRKIMFAKPESFGNQTMMLQHQGAPGEKYAENTRVEHNGVMFVGLNVPGSNNNKVNNQKSCTHKSARTAADCDADNAEWKARNAADLAWMQSSFAKAKANGDKGIVIVVQADPGFDVPETEDVNESRLPQNDGYAAFLDTLTNGARVYDGQVLLVHGDTHYFKVDKPLIDYGHMVPNITRVETFGSPHVHWVKLLVDPNARGVFTVQPMIVPANADKTLGK